MIYCGDDEVIRQWPAAKNNQMELAAARETLLRRLPLGGPDHKALRLAYRAAHFAEPEPRMGLLVPIALYVIGVALLAWALVAAFVF